MARPEYELRDSAGGRSLGTVKGDSEVLPRVIREARRLDREVQAFRDGRLVLRAWPHAGRVVFERV